MIIKRKLYSDKKNKIRLNKNESISHVLDYTNAMADGNYHSGTFINGKLVKDHTENIGKSKYLTDKNIADRASKTAVDSTWNSAIMRRGRPNAEAVVETNPFKKKILYIGGNGSKSITVSNKSIEDAVKDHIKVGGEIKPEKEAKIIKDLKKGMTRRRINQGLVVSIPTAAAIIGAKAIKKKRSKKLDKQWTSKL